MADPKGGGLKERKKRASRSAREGKKGDDAGGSRTLGDVSEYIATGKGE